MSSTELFDAASISITSSELARAIDTHESHSPHGSIVGPALAVQARREDLRHRGLARAARADEQVGVVDLAALAPRCAACARPAPGRPPRRTCAAGACDTATAAAVAVAAPLCDTVRLSLPTRRAGHRPGERCPDARRAERVASALMTASIKRLPRASRRPARRSPSGRVAAAADRAASASPTTTRSTRSPGAGSSRAATPPPTASRSRPRRTRCVELLGLVLSPLGPRAVEDVTVALGFLALSACGWVVYRLGARLVRPRRRRARGADLPHARAGPLLRRARLRRRPLPAARARRAARRVAPPPRRAGAPVLVLLALAGLLRPEAWAFSGLYWLYLMRLRTAQRAAHARRCCRDGAPASSRG